VLHSPEILYHEVQTISPQSRPVTFTSKKNDTDQNGKICLDFESDFRNGYHIVPPQPVTAQAVEDPWFNVTTPEEEANIEEAEIAKKIALQEGRRKELINDPTADEETTRDLLLITRLGKKSEKLMQQLETLSNLQGAENTPEVIAEAKKLLDLYDGIKKQIANAVMKYASYHDFEGDFSSTNNTLTFPMENPKPPHGQQDIVKTTHSSHTREHFDLPVYKSPSDGDAESETVYSPLEHPEPPVIE